MVDQRLKVVPHRPEGPGADVQGLAADRSREAPRDGVDEILHGEELIEVAAVAEDRNASPLADPVEEDLEHTEPFRADERLRSHDHDVEPTTTELAGEQLRVDLRLAVPPHADERIGLVDRVMLRHAVDGRRRDENHPPDAGAERGSENVGGALDVHRADRLARRLNR